jgi:hypothetical protein
VKIVRNMGLNLDIINSSVKPITRQTPWKCFAEAYARDLAWYAERERNPPKVGRPLTGSA